MFIHEIQFFLVFSDIKLEPQKCSTTCFNSIPIDIGTSKSGHFESTNSLKKLKFNFKQTLLSLKDSMRGILFLLVYAEKPIYDPV